MSAGEQKNKCPEYVHDPFWVGLEVGVFPELHRVCAKCDEDPVTLVQLVLAITVEGPLPQTHQL